MKALRLLIHQNSANYRKEETIDNKMTYPLPPFSTVIGALHSACDFTEYHEMDLSIQGRYESMHKEPYTDYCFLNSVMDDRGILVKMDNGNLLSKAFQRVASAQKSQGNSFRNNVTILIHNQSLLKEYQNLKEVNDQISKFKKYRIEPVYSIIKARKKRLAEKKKKYEKSSLEYKKISLREKEIKDMEKLVKAKLEEFQSENYSKPISRYRSVTTSLKYYEILNNIELIIHIKADEDTLSIIQKNIYNLKAIGRSEDTVQVREAEIVDLLESEDCNVESPYSAYIGYEELINEEIFPQNVNASEGINGTKYYLNKNYEIINGKRIFKKKKAMYLSHYGIEKTSQTVYIDEGDKEQYIVNLL